MDTTEDDELIFGLDDDHVKMDDDNVEVNTTLEKGKNLYIQQELITPWRDLPFYIKECYEVLENITVTIKWKSLTNQVTTLATLPISYISRSISTMLADSLAENKRIFNKFLEQLNEMAEGSSISQSSSNYNLVEKWKKQLETLTSFNIDIHELDETSSNTDIWVICSRLKQNVEAVIKFVTLCEGKKPDLKFTSPLISSNMEDILRKTDHPIKEWFLQSKYNTNDIKHAEKEHLYLLLLTASYFGVNVLIKLCEIKIASLIRGKPIDQIHDALYYNIENLCVSSEPKQTHKRSKKQITKRYQKRPKTETTGPGANIIPISLSILLKKK